MIDRLPLVKLNGLLAPGEHSPTRFALPDDPGVDGKL